MYRLFTLSFVLFSFLTLSAQEYKEQAEQMNREAQEYVSKIEKRTVRDSIIYYRLAVDIVNASLKCDEYDRMPNRKGLVKPRYERANHERLHKYVPALIDAGVFFVENYMRQEGVSAWKLYLKSRLNPLIKEDTDESGIAAYYLAQMELMSHNYKAADRYADIALQNDETAQVAAEVKAQCMKAQMVSAEDSLRYLAVLEELYRTDPTNTTYFSWIMQFYNKPTTTHNIENFIDRQLAENPHSVVPWILKGEVAMHAQRWEEAVEAYRQADEIDPTRVPVIYNIAVCLNNHVLELQKEGSKTSKTELENLLVLSRNYLERVKSRDPRRSQVDWVKPLYLVYSLLGDKIKADELAPIVNGFKK